MNVNISYSTGKLLSGLSNLTKDIGVWLDSRNPINKFDIWRDALDSSLVSSVPVSDIAIERAASAFMKAFNVYNEPANPRKMTMLTLNDFKNAEGLAESWTRTMTVVAQQGAVNVSAMSTELAHNDFLKTTARWVSRNTARDAVEFFNTDSVANALRSSNFLSEACAAAAATATQEYIAPDVQQHRLETFQGLQDLLKSSVAMGAYTTTPFLEVRLREMMQQNNQSLEKLHRTNNNALAILNEEISAANMGM